MGRRGRVTRGGNGEQYDGVDVCKIGYVVIGLVGGAYDGFGGGGEGGGGGEENGVTISPYYHLRPRPCITMARW